MSLAEEIKPADRAITPEMLKEMMKGGGVEIRMGPKKGGEMPAHKKRDLKKKPEGKKKPAPKGPDAAALIKQHDPDRVCR